MKVIYVLQIISFLFVLPRVEAQLSNLSELTALTSGGNTIFSTYNLKTSFKYEFLKFDIEAGGHYTYGTYLETITSRNWDFNLKETRKLEHNIGLFLGQQIEGDRFAGIDQIVNLDIGIKYHLIKNEKNDLFCETGMRWTKEKDVLSATENYAKGRFYLEGSRKHSEDIYLKMWAEFTPNFSKSSDWFLQAEPSINVTLSRYLSFKFGYKYIYKNDPPKGKQKYDYISSSTLIAKF